MSVPEGVDPRELDQDVRSDLRSLAKDTAELAAQHLIMVGRLIDEDPVQALAHARAATALAGRVAAVREAAGLAAYAAQEWALALSELRTARRISGRPDHLAVLADCERALDRPERALAVLDDPDVKRLDQATRVELVIVVAGARRDLGELDAAVLLLQVPAQGTKERHPWAARLWYAYADALLAAGRPEARDWFERAASVDEGETEALDRLLELDGVAFESLDDEEEPDGPSVTLEELGLQPVTQEKASDPVSSAADQAAADDAPRAARREEGAGVRDVGPAEGVREAASTAGLTAGGVPDGAGAGMDHPEPDGRETGGAGFSAAPSPGTGEAAEAQAAPDDAEVGASPGAGTRRSPEEGTAELTSRHHDESVQHRPPLVPAPLFSHDEEPLPKPASTGVPGQQDLFSDLGD